MGCGGMTNDDPGCDPHFAALSMAVCKAIEDYAANGGVLIKDAARAAAIEAAVLYVGELHPDLRRARAQAFCREVADSLAPTE